MVEFRGDVSDGREVVIGGAEMGAGGKSIEPSPSDAIELSAAMAAKSGGFGMVLSFSNEEGLNSCSSSLSEVSSLSLSRSPDEADRVGDEQGEDVAEEVALDCDRFRLSASGCCWSVLSGATTSEYCNASGGWKTER